MSSEDLGFLLLIGSNLVLVALALFVFLVLSRSLARRDAALAATTEQFASISQQLAELRRALASLPAAAPADSDPTPLLQELMTELDPQAVAPIAQALGQSLGLVNELQAVSDAQYPAWKAAHQGQIDELVAHRERLERDVAELKDKLERAHRLVATLHAKNRRLSGAQNQLEHLEVMNNSLSEELSRAKLQRRELEQELDKRHQLLAAKHAELAKAKGLVQVQEQQHANVSAQLQAEIDALHADLAKEREILSRTLVEKDFIETVYVETDASLDELKRVQQELLQLSQENQALHARLAQLGTSLATATPPPA